MKLGAWLLTLGYGVFVGVMAQRNGVPRMIVDKTREFIDTETRRTARIMTDEIHKRHAELEAVKA